MPPVGGVFRHLRRRKALSRREFMECRKGELLHLSNLFRRGEKPDLADAGTCFEPVFLHSC